MNNTYIKDFASVDIVRDAVRDYILQFMKDKAGAEALLGKDVSGYKEAKETIIGAFIELEKTYKIKEDKPIVNHSI
jgi:hypothetical protein